MSDFSKFAALAKQQFDAMSKNELFVLNVSGDDVFAKYLESFPEGSNPIYRERTEHDCSCCKQFIRNLGNVVYISDSGLVSVWDVLDAEYPYGEVAARLSEFVKQYEITSLFRTSERSYGAVETIEHLDNDDTHAWNHFFGQIHRKHCTSNVGADVGEYTMSVGVFRRGLEELAATVFDDVIGLIENKALYRGEEFLNAVRGFKLLRGTYYCQDEGAARNRFIWANAGNPLARFRNTAIGTLLQDLSEGMGLEQAVKSFEGKVAPTNYKRPTSLVTPRMKQDALKTIQELNLEDALSRRFARITDVSINNVLWADNSVQPLMKGGIEGLLLNAAPSSKPNGKATDISIDDFEKLILPQVTTMELQAKNQHQSNFMSLTAPVHAEVEPLFKWSNNFGWSYDGNITDSIKERVKAAGGKTDAVLRVSLAWFNYDDLDLHAYEPNCGAHIYFGNRGAKSPIGRGALDVDMHVGKGTSRVPVENIVWETPQDGDYRIVVHNYCKRETSDIGFTLEVESGGEVHQYSCAKSPANGAYAGDLILTVKDRKVVAVKPDASLIGGTFSQEKWGVSTEQFIKVNTLMKSPNHWDGQTIGNKHWFFVLDNCKNPLPARGIYNEFLNAKLEPHRKVFELLGEMTKCQPTDDQLSGVGFSSTKQDSVLVNVTGPKLNKTYNLIF